MSRPPFETALVRWETAYRAGQDLTPTELLPAHPELHDTLAPVLARLRAAARAARTNRLLVGALVLALLLGGGGVWYYAAAAQREAASARALQEQIDAAVRDSEANLAIARKHARDAEQQRYAVQIARAQEAWAADNRENVKRVLGDVPAPLRLWEWRYLQGVPGPAFAPDGTPIPRDKD